MRKNCALLLGAITLLVTSCGSAGGIDTAAPTETVKVTATETVTATPTSTDAPSGVAEAELESTEPVETEDFGTSDSEPTEGPKVIGPNDAGRILVLSDFFRPDDDWKQNRYDIASKSNITGIGKEISTCGDYDPEVLQLRLGNNFTKIDFSVGQDNLSSSTDQKLVVRVIGNNKELEVYRVPFNKYQTFSVDVSNVNALSIQTYLDEEVEDCGGSALAVFYDMKLQ